MFIIDCILWIADEDGGCVRIGNLSSWIDFWIGGISAGELCTCFNFNPKGFV